MPSEPVGREVLGRHLPCPHCPRGESHGPPEDRPHILPIFRPGKEPKGVEPALPPCLASLHMTPWSQARLHEVPKARVPYRQRAQEIMRTREKLPGPAAMLGAINTQDSKPVSSYDGRMLGFSRNRFVGSYLFFRVTSRS